MSGPVPDGRGRWRVTLHNRVYSDISQSPNFSQIGELTSARSRRLEQQWNQPAQFSFVLDGHSDEAKLIQEMAHDVYVWRWDENYGTTGNDRAMFRGIISQSQDTVSEQTHTVTFTAHDYFAMLGRRFLWAYQNYTAYQQDNIVRDLLHKATDTAQSTGGTPLSPGSYLPLQLQLVGPDGYTYRGPVQPRDRQYTAGSSIGDLISNLAAVINGFDFAVVPGPFQWDWLNLYYPQQGVTRTDPLVYGINVANFSRTVDSNDYANFWRVLGNNESSVQSDPPRYAEAWSPDANNVAQAPQGLWQDVDNQADVTVQATLNETASGDLNRSSVVIPSYSLGLRPGWYTYSSLFMGETFPLIIKSGRLDVNSIVRILGITYDIGDDGQEDISITVGRPAQTLIDLLTQQDKTVHALVRR